MSNPKVKVPLTFLDYVLEIIGLGVFVGFWIFIFHCYKVLPDKVVTHYSHGKINGFGSKNNLFVGLAIVSAVYILITIMTFFSRLIINGQNSLYQYRLGTRFAMLFKILVMTFIFNISLELKISTETGAGESQSYYDLIPMALLVLTGIGYAILAATHKTNGSKA